MVASIAQARGQGAEILTGFALQVKLAGAHNWTPKSIKQHMDTEAAKLPGNIWWRVERRFGGVNQKLGDRLFLLKAVAAIGTFVSLLTFVISVVLVAVAPAFDLPRELLLAVSIGSAGAAVILFEVTMLIHALTAWVTVIPPATWNEYSWNPLGNYAHTMGVPEAPTQMARQLLEAVPGTTFIVAKLECFERTGLFDPVLFAVEKTPRGIVLHPMCAWNPDGSIIKPPA